MHGGRIVEMGPRDEVLSSPRHSYTQRLMQAVPIADVDVKRDLSMVLSEHKMPDPIRNVSVIDEVLKYEDVGHEHIVALNY